MNTRRSRARLSSQPSPRLSSPNPPPYPSPEPRPKAFAQPVATRSNRQSTPLSPAVRGLAWLLARMAAAEAGRGGSDL